VARADSSYTFGDTPLAAARLELLAEVFSDATTAFLSGLEAGHPRLAVDLGCGPGFTTALLDELVEPECVVGVDSSVAFASQASERLGPRMEVICADALELPERVSDADLIYARFLLTHVTDPNAAIEHWLGRLAPNGVLAIQEVESITTDEPTLTRYLELQQRMLEANRNSLYVGPVIACAHPPSIVVRNDVVPVTPPLSTVARMFAMNLEGWRNHAAADTLAGTSELKQVADGLEALTITGTSEASVAWELRELVLARPTAGHRARP
jgi:trans-aconitate 2-methyltransferase